MPAAPAPVFLLAPPRCELATVFETLGQHPQVYCLPQTHLFSAPTVAAWWRMCSRSSFHTMEHGLLRAVAQLYFDEQTDAAIQLAEGWLRRRSHFTTAFMFEALAERVAPRVLIEKSASLVSSRTNLGRVLRMFPGARFIHVVQHPRGYGECLMRAIQQAAQRGPVPYWLLELASFPAPSTDNREGPSPGSSEGGLDPQHAWLSLHANAWAFLSRVPDNQKMVLPVEDLMSDLEPTLRRVADWLGLRTDPEAINAMQHPERSPYACYGPTRARYGNEPALLQTPTLALGEPQKYCLDGPLSWRPTPQEFVPEVRALAVQFGYR